MADEIPSRIMTWLTWVIAIATAVNALAVVVLVCITRKYAISAQRQADAAESISLLAASVRFDVVLFPLPARRTGQAHFVHPALGEKFTVLPTKS